MTILEPGRRVSEHLELVRPLGHGAMGEVWVARHVNLETEVAVKFVHRQNADDPEVRARFEVEAKAAARLKSPHVVQVFDHGVTDEGMPFLVMELLEGENLDQRLEREIRLPPAVAADILEQVAKALVAAHDQGIVHRDVKPGNIFLCPDGDDILVKLLDFGVARAETFDRKLTQSGVMVGTPSYISREMVTSPGPVDHRADLWALAVVAYEMITGDVPFTGDTVGLVCVSIVAGTPYPASSMAAVPPAVDAFFARAFAIPIDERFQNATELAAAFSLALAGQAPETIAIERAPRRPNAVAETLPPRERGSVDPMISERPGARSPASASPAEADARRRWPWALAALVAIVALGLSARRLTASGPDEANPSLAASGAVAPAPLGEPESPPVASSAATTRSETESAGATAAAEGGAAGQAKPPPGRGPVPRPKASRPVGSPPTVGRDDYGF